VAAGETAGEATAVGEAGAAGAAEGGGAIATLLAPEIVIPVVLAVLTGLGIWWLIDKIKNDPEWASSKWEETKNFWGGVGSGIASGAKWVGNETVEAFTKASEGLRHLAYRDGSGQSIGYGHQILPGENFAGGVTTAQADALYKSDMAKAMMVVNKLTAGLGLNSNQTGALADYQYNTGALGNSRILALIRAGRLDEAAKAFETSRITSGGVYNQGLFNRRLGEEKIFRTAPNVTMNTQIDVHGTNDAPGTARGVLRGMGDVASILVRHAVGVPA
jgi:GH24 family phage-related lysozyme (muramidase)